jgi:4-amino-4-deoxy-L-arabinose transferase-like glycosyltransferase
MNEYAEGFRQKSDRGLGGFWPAFIFLLLIPALWWSWVDQSVWPWDSSAYGEVSINLYLALRHSVLGWARMMWTALPNRSPALVWLGEFFVPIGVALGRPEFGLRICAWLVQVANACLVYRVAIKLFGNAKAAFVASVFICSAPLFVGMTQTYMTEPIQGLGVALFFYFLCDAERKPLARTALLLGIAFVFAMMGKITALLYVVCGAVLFLNLARQRRSELRHPAMARSDIALAALLAAMTGAFVLWFYLNYAGVISHARDASSGAFAINYGSRAGLGYKIPFWTQGFLASFLHPFVRPFVAAGMLWALWLSRRRIPAMPWGNWVALSCAAQIAMVLLVFSFNIVEEPRYTFPLFICFGLLLAWMVDALPSRAMGVAAALAMTQFVLVYGQAYGLVAPSPKLSAFLLPVDTAGAHLRALEMALERSCANSDPPNKLFAVGLDIPYFNADSFSFYSRISSLHSGRKCWYVNLGVAASDADTAWNDMVKRNPAGVLFLKNEISHISPADVFNRVSSAVYGRLQHSPAFRQENIAENPEILLFRSVASQWKFQSALFRANAGVWSNANGTATWTVHPAFRRSGDQTVIVFDGPLPKHAVISGAIQSCDGRCAGVALEFEMEGSRSTHEVVLLPAPVQGRTFAQTLPSQEGDRLLVRVRSLDAAHDQIDFCWITVANVRVQSTQP